MKDKNYLLPIPGKINLLVVKKNYILYVMSENNFLIGNLLVASNMLKPEDLNEALQISRSHSLPIGKVLLMSEYISDKDLKLALDAQLKASQLNLTANQIVKILKFAFKNKISIDEAIQKQTARLSENIPESNLPITARLLIASLLLNKNEVEQALETSKASNLPFGRVLINTNKIPVSTLSKCLAIQFLLKDDKISWNNAASILKDAHHKNVSLNTVLDSHSTPNTNENSSPFKLGDILIKSKLIDEINFLQGLELSLINKKLVGEELIKLGFINKTTLDKALEAQSLIRTESGIYDENTIYLALRTAVAKNIELKASLNSLVNPKTSSASIPASASPNAAKSSSDSMPASASPNAAKSSSDSMPASVSPNAVKSSSASIPASVSPNAVKSSSASIPASVSPNAAKSSSASIPASNPGSTVRPKEQIPETLPLYQFVQLSGLITSNQIQDAIKKACLDTSLLLEILKKSGLIDENSLNTLKDCYKILSSGKIKCEQAIIALNYSTRSRISFVEALKELNIKI